MKQEFLNLFEKFEDQTEPGSDEIVANTRGPNKSIGKIKCYKEIL